MRFVRKVGSIRYESKTSRSTWDEVHDLIGYYYQLLNKPTLGYSRDCRSRKSYCASVYQLCICAVRETACYVVWRALHSGKNG